MRLDIDEVVINNMIGIVDKEKVFECYSRVVATYKQLNPKELKGLCLEIVNSEELFEEFVKSLVII